MNPNAAFEAEMNRLNPAQRKAVETIEGPVMVVAGPGTGKTQVLTLRIANIIAKTDTAPDEILALTFTEAGVAAMRRRLLEIVGSRGYAVAVNTFHGFCNDIIKNYPEEFPRVIGANQITEVDQIAIIENLIRAGGYKELKPFGDPLYYVRAILASVNKLKREGVSPDDFTAAITSEREAFEENDDRFHRSGPHAGKMKGKYIDLLRDIKKNEELSGVYREYEAALQAARLYDFSDMIMEVLSVLRKKSDLLLTLQEKYQYVLVDEHQDTNNAQNRVLELLMSFHPNPNIFVVGDEKQAIFRFQGASLENFLHFKKLYPGAILIALEENYRSSQTILDSASAVLAGPVSLKSRAGHEEKPIRLLALARPEVELHFLAKDIEEKMSAGAAPESIAVLYRDNRDALPIIRILEKRGIPFSVESDQNVLDDPEIKKLVAVLRGIERFGADEYFLECLHVDFFGIPPLDVWRLASVAARERQSVVALSARAENLPGLELAAPEKIAALYRLFSSWKTLSKNRGAIDAFEAVVRESGFLAHILNSGRGMEAMQKLGMIFDEVKSLVERHKSARLKDFLEYLDSLERHEILVKRVSSTYLTHRVRLMTAHRSKGQEFDYVYIVNCYDGHWGNKRRAELLKLPAQVFSLVGTSVGAADDDDERRLFYVALTRARKEVVISYAKESASRREQLPAKFIGEIKPEIMHVVDGAPYEADFERNKDILFAPPRPSGVSIADRDFVRALFLERGLAVTALNNYLNCPWEYFYVNLLRIPKSPTKHQMYGTAVHAALKDFFDAAKERGFDKDLLLNAFKGYLSREPLSEPDFDEAAKKGAAALSGYFGAYAGVRKANVLTELSVPGVILTPEIRLTGKLDKIEFLDDGRSVNVVDYKTGRPKTRAEIEGRTKNSDGAIKRQLTFYNLLLNMHDGGRYRMVSGEIDFVEPDERGRYRKENFIVELDEIVELDGLIRKVAGEIINLEFWERRCGREGCDFCALREMMASGGKLG